MGGYWKDKHTWTDHLYLYLILSLRISTRSSKACLKALMITVGCICCWRKGSATESISPPGKRWQSISIIANISYVSIQVLPRWKSRHVSHKSYKSDMELRILINHTKTWLLNLFHKYDINDLTTPCLGLISDWEQQVHFQMRCEFSSLSLFFPISPVLCRLLIKAYESCHSL